MKEKGRKVREREIERDGQEREWQEGREMEVGRRKEGKSEREMGRKEWKQNSNRAWVRGSDKGEIHRWRGLRRKIYCTIHMKLTTTTIPVVLSNLQ